MKKVNIYSTHIHIFHPGFFFFFLEIFEKEEKKKERKRKKKEPFRASRK